MCRNFLRPLKYLHAHRKITPVAVLYPLDWVLSGLLASTSSFVSTCLKAVAFNQGLDTEQVDGVRMYDMESYGAYKQVNSHSPADVRTTRLLEETNYHDGYRYQVGKVMDNSFSAVTYCDS